MKYVPALYNNTSLIAFGTVLIVAIVAIAIIALIQPKFDHMKWLSRRRLNGICLGIGLIIGLCMASCNDFKVFDELDTSNQWYWHASYLIAGLSNLCITILLVGFALLIPFRLVVNIYAFTHYKNQKKKFGELSLIYAIFGLIAIGVCLLMYPLSNTFLSESTSSRFSLCSTPLATINPDGSAVAFQAKPTIYIVGSYVLVSLLKVKTLNFTFWFSIYFVIATILAITLVCLAKQYQWNKFDQAVKVIDKCVTKINGYLGIVTTIFTFIAIIACLMIQPAGTGLRFALILILMTILWFIIWGVDFIWVLANRHMTAKEFVEYSKHAFIITTKKPIHDKFMDDLVAHPKFNHLKGNTNEKQIIYNMFVTSIYSIIIVAYLGFSAGPLHTNHYYAAVNGIYQLKHFELWQHIVYWVSLYCLGYVLALLYSFKHNDGGSFRMMLSGAAPWIHSGYNTGILNYFNTYIDKLAMFSSYTTYIALNSHWKHKHFI